VETADDGRQSPRRRGDSGHDPEVLASFQFLLEVAGHAVDAYASATAFLEDRAARPSCLILDQHMPTMTGLELAARLRADRADIPLLLITADLTPKIVARAGEIGIEKVLEKPLAEDDLLNFIDGCI
jgi:FixJ family two-component response regulator